MAPAGRVKNTIRKVERARLAAFDEQLWPVNLALVVLAGFVAGLIISQGGFYDPNPLHNAWVRLVALAVNLGGLFWLAERLNRRLARRMQLAVLVSVILHLCVVVFLGGHYLSVDLPQEEVAQSESPREAYTVPEYHLPDPQQQADPQEFEKPLRTDFTPAEEVPRERPEMPREVQLPQPEAVVDRQEQPQPTPQVQRQRSALPRRAEQQSQLSKQTAQAQARPQQAVQVPDQPAPHPSEQRLEQTTSVERPANAAPARPAQQSAESQSDRRVEAQPNRAERSQPRVEVARAAVLKRSVNKPTETPRTSISAAQTAQPRQPKPAERPQPRPSSVARARSASPAPDAPQPALEHRQQTEAEAQRQQPAEAAPRIARSQRPSEQRQQVETSIRRDAPVAPEQPVAQRATPNTVPQPQRADVHRQVTRAETSEQAAVATDTAVVRPRSQVAQQRPSETPTLLPQAAPTDQPRRTSESARVATTAREAARSPVARAPEPANTALAPNPTTVTRSQTVSPRVTQAAAEPTTTAETEVVAQASDGRRQQPQANPSLQSNPALARSSAPNRQAVATAAADAPSSSSSPSESPAENTLAASESSVARARTAASENTASAAAADAPGATSREVAAMAARATVADAPAVSASANLSTQPARASQVAQVTASPAAQPAESSSQAVASEQPRQLAAGKVLLERSPAGGPQVTRERASPVFDSSRSLAQADISPRQQTSSSTPTLSQSTADSPSRRTSAATVTSNAAATIESVANAPAETNRSAPGPASSQLARQATGPAAAASDQPSPSVAGSNPTVAASRAIAAARTSDVPSVTPQNNATARPQRVEQTARIAASPASVESPAVAESQAQSRPAAQPAASALARAETGLAGRGNASNRNVGMPASARNLAAAPSSAAERAEALQQQPGPSLAPSAPAQIAKSRAGAETPSTTTKATTDQVARVAGSSDPSELNSSASAAVERMNARAKMGSLTASAGETQLDTGVPQIVPDVEDGRAAGGGQPNVGPGPRDAQLAKAQAGGAQVVAVQARDVAPQASAPQGTDGGSPPGPQAAKLAADAGRRTGGAALPRVATMQGATAEREGKPGGKPASAEIARASLGGPAGGSSKPGAPGEPADNLLARSQPSGGTLSTLAADVEAPAATAPQEGTAGGGTSGPVAATRETSPRQGGGGSTAAKQELKQTLLSAAEEATAGKAGGAAQRALSGKLQRAEASATGGAPRIAAGRPGKRIAKAQAGGATTVTLAAADIAEHTAAPLTDGGGSPPGEFASTAEAAAEKQTTAAGALQADRLAAGPDAGSGGSSGQVASGTIQRASATEALPGMSPGGGTAQPAKGRPHLAGLVPTAVPDITAAPQQGGAESGRPQLAQGAGPLGGPQGVPGKAQAKPTGALAGPSEVDSDSSGAAGAGSPLAKATGGTPSAPSLGSVSSAGGLGKRSGQAGLPGGGAADAAIPAAPGGEDGPSMSDPAALAAAGGEVGKAAAAMRVELNAREGTGGLGAKPELSVGITDRRAHRESQIIKRQGGKFLQKQDAGAALLDGKARVVAPSFRRRLERNRLKTEPSIELGIDFLARHQSPDGSWSFHNFGTGRPGYEKETAAIESDAAATGLALLAFLGAGYDHLEDKYREEVGRGLAFLLAHQKQSDNPLVNGDLYISQDATTNQVARLYSHGIATIALCEAYGMTGDQELGQAAQRAIDFIVATQHPDRGGWRYSPRYSSDLSVTGWQLMALKSGALAGLEVPRESIDAVKQFVDRCQDGEDGSQYCYNPHAANTAATRHGRQPSTVMTSVGLLMRLYTGWDRQRIAMQRGADHLLANLPTHGREDFTARTGTEGNPRRDTYYWYYATQVMFHMQGDYWEQWSSRLRDLLLSSQVKQGPLAGSWDPRLPVPDKWGPHGGRIYITTMNLLSLEVQWRHLPIYVDTAE